MTVGSKPPAWVTNDLTCTYSSTYLVWSTIKVHVYHRIISSIIIIMIIIADMCSFLGCSICLQVRKNNPPLLLLLLHVV